MKLMHSQQTTYVHKSVLQKNQITKSFVCKIDVIHAVEHQKLQAKTCSS